MFKVPGKKDLYIAMADRWHEWGINMKPFGDDYEYMGHAYPGRPRVWLKYDGHNQKQVLTSQAKKEGVKILNHHPIIDLIKVVNCTGMGSHKIAYRKAGASAAAEQTEGAPAATATLAEFDFVTITPTSYAVLDFISKQAKKQTTLQYAAKVKEQAMVALRR